MRDDLRCLANRCGLLAIAWVFALPVDTTASAADPASPLTLVAQYKQSQGKPTSPAELFAALDADGNGRVDRAEWKTRKMAIFYIRDVNGDIQLSRQEMPGLAADVFAKADLNNDGMLSGYEFNQAPFTQFEAAATGAAAADGVTLDGFKAYLKTLDPRPQPR